jgi:serine/threonine protein phosphatase PrpC
MAIMLTFHGVTHPGLVRRINEDGLCHDLGLGLFVVADGLGGHNSGEIASRMALESVHSFIQHTNDDDEFTWPFGVDMQLSFDANRMRTALRLANRRVFQASEERVEYAGMGTTIVALLVSGRTLTFASIGDSRIYSCVNGALTRLTVDDSWLATLAAQQPDLDPAQLADHPLRHVITRAVGTLAETELEIEERTLTDGETLLLCSDGLHDLVTDEELGRVLASTPALDAAAQALLDRAIAAGGRDNVTALLVRYDED